MKEIEVTNIPEGSVVLRAHEGDYDGRVPQNHIIEVFRHMGGDLIMTFDDFFNQFIRIRCGIPGEERLQLEFHTKDIPPNSLQSFRMIRDI